ETKHTEGVEMTSNEEFKSVSLPLSQDESVILLELLARLLDDHDAAVLLPLVEHDAELWVLNHVHGLLEKRLVQPFRSNYGALLDEARARVLAARGPWPR